MEYELPVENESQILPWVFRVKNRSSSGREIEWRQIEYSMRPVKVKCFSFQVFYDKSELVKKFGQYIIATEKLRIWSVNQFVLRNNQSIIHKKNERNRNVKIF